MLKLRAERESQGLSIEWVADRVGLTKQAISSYETDLIGRARPSEDVFRKWVGGLDLPAVEWLDDWLDALAIERIDDALGARGVAEFQRGALLEQAAFRMRQARAAPSRDKLQAS